MSKTLDVERQKPSVEGFGNAGGVLARPGAHRLLEITTYLVDFRPGRYTKGFSSPKATVACILGSQLDRVPVKNRDL